MGWCSNIGPLERTPDAVEALVRPFTVLSADGTCLATRSAVALTATGAGTLGEGVPRLTVHRRRKREQYVL